MPEPKLDSLALSDTEKASAARLRSQVVDILRELNSAREKVSQDFMDLGTALHEIRAKQYWRDWSDGENVPFSSFGRYIDSLPYGRTQLYNAISVVEKLTPYLRDNQLRQMGISKAIELRRLVANTGKRPSEGLVRKALDPHVDVQQLRAEIFVQTNVKSPSREGTYYDLGGIFVTANERKEFERAFDVAEKTDPVIAKHIPDHVRRKEILWRLCANYLATYEKEVSGK